MRRGMIIASLAMAAVLAVGVVAVTPSAAQGPATPVAPSTPSAPDGRGPGGNRGGMVAGLLGFTACSTTDYTSVAAQALGMTAADLRVALVSGKTLSSIADSKSVTVQAIRAAMAKAQATDVDQAVTDGLLTQAQGDAIKARLTRIENASTPGTAATPSATQPTTPANPTQPGGPRNGGRPPMTNGAFGFGLRLSTQNPVHEYSAAAQAIGISCADLVKALAQRQTIAQVASGKNVQAQTVIDAIVKAHQDALAQDVKDGLITQAEADGRSVNLTKAATALVNGRGVRTTNSAGGSMFPGFGGTNGGFGGGFFNIGRLFQLFGGRGFPGFGGGMFPGFGNSSNRSPFPGFGNGGRRGNNGTTPATPSATQAAGSST